MALEFGERIKELDESIGVLKHELLFLMAERRPENVIQITTIKRELDEAVQEKMRLSQVYCNSADSITLTATSA
jgi:hypothetical protein